MHLHAGENTDQLVKIYTLSNSATIKQIGLELGFQQVGIADVELDSHRQHYTSWIARNFHGEMAYMERSVNKRLHPAQLVPNTLSVICVRLDYLPAERRNPLHLLGDESLA